MYRHALPPGFVFKTKKKSDDEDTGTKISLEQLVEEEVGVSRPRLLVLIKYNCL